MKKRRFFEQALALCLTAALVLPVSGFSQETSGAAQESPSAPVFKVEELDQMVAPIALYPDSLLAQIFMASTYPLEVVQAQRWAEQNKGLTGDALTAALEKESWDPSVKSLVNFPDVLTMMNDKLDWTQKLGDAFLSQQKDVLDTVQRLRDKAKAEGNLKSTEEQKVVVEGDTIIIEPADPEVIYVPSYNPTIVYGSWWYPSYPPYYWYPPYYPPVVTPYYGFFAGAAMGAAWGYAWGHCDWNGGDVDIDIDRNTNINNNIDRDAAKQKMQERGQSGKGEWKHNPESRKGVSYRDSATAGKYDRMASSDKISSREQYRGRAESGRQELARGGASASTRDLSRAGGTRDGSRGSGSQVSNRASSGSRSSAFDNSMDRGSSTRSYSAQGKSSRSSMNRSSSSGSRGGGGGSRGGGGGSRGGGGGGRR